MPSLPTIKNKLVDCAKNYIFGHEIQDILTELPKPDESEIRRRAGGRSGKSYSYIYDDDERHNYRDNQSFALSPTRFLLFIGIIIVLFLFIGIHFNDRLPGRGIKDKVGPHFNAHNAVENLVGLVKLGPKVTGSLENEVEAVTYLTDHIYDIMKKTNPKHNISFDLQKVSGNFSLLLFTKTANIVYANVQNVIVKLGPKPYADKSLLLNCHFDSAPTSPGASDDGLNCAVLLEVLRVFATSDEALPYNLIFLFNGAEENPLLASHGFTTQHKWVKDIRAVINLESCGAGGREVLFQTSPNHPWLIEAYSKGAKYPSGVVIAEEMFQSGLVPSDTDFRIFRDYGNIPGLDFAHCKNGYAYHTKSDNLESIENIYGVIKHTGENILSVAKSIIHSEEFKDSNSKIVGRQVYFDFFGLWFINYSVETAKYINACTIIIAITGIFITVYHQQTCKPLRNSLLYSFAVMGGSIIMSVAYNLALAFLLDLMGFSMSWYSHSLFIIPLYAIPIITIMAINTVVFDDFRKTKTSFNLKIKSNYLGILLFWTSLLLLSTFTNLRSTFLLTFLVLPPAVYTLITSFIHHISTRFQWVGIYLAVTFPASSFLTYFGVMAFRLFIPITGRSGGEKNPEFVISIIASLMAIAILCYLPTLILAVKRRWIAINILIISHFVFVIYIMTLPSGFPFSVAAPQRVSVTHVNRQFFDAELSLKRSDSLFWVQNMDRRGREVLPVLKDAPILEKFCEKDGYCGLPWQGKIHERKSSSCVSSAPHELTDETHLELVSKMHITKNIIRYEFNISGPDHMGVILTPSDKVTLISWNLPGKIEKQPSYNLTFVYGLYHPQFNVWFDLMVEDSTPRKSYFQIEVYGLYLHHDKYFSQGFKNFIKKFPQWSDVTPSLAMYKSFQF